MCALSSILLSLCVSLEPGGVEAYNTPLLLDPDFYEPTSTKSIKQQSLNAEHLKYMIAPVSLKGDSNSRFFSVVAWGNKVAGCGTGCCDTKSH